MGLERPIVEKILTIVWQKNTPQAKSLLYVGWVPSLISVFLPLGFA